MTRTPEWWPSWEGETVVLVGAGPTAKDAPLDMAHGAVRVIAINDSWRLTPWADILYACDLAWWKNARGCPQFGRLKLTVDRKAAERYPDVNLVACMKPDDRIFLEPLGTVGWGGNSGFHALNLAVQFGCRKIILVGYDMRMDHGLHWHGRHPAPMSNPTTKNVGRWRRAVDNAWKAIRPLGIEVINCSPISALQSYPKMGLEEALAA